LERNAGDGCLVHLDGSGVAFVHETRSGLVSSAFSPSFDLYLLQAWPSGDLSRDHRSHQFLLLVKVTEFEDGYCICLQISHLIMDGSAVGHLLTSWTNRLNGKRPPPLPSYTGPHLCPFFSEDSSLGQEGTSTEKARTGIAATLSYLLKAGKDSSTAGWLQKVATAKTYALTIQRVVVRGAFWQSFSVVFPWSLLRNLSQHSDAFADATFPDMGLLGALGLILGATLPAKQKRAIFAVMMENRQEKSLSQYEQGYYTTPPDAAPRYTFEKGSDDQFFICNEKDGTFPSHLFNPMPFDGGQMDFGTGGQMLTWRWSRLAAQPAVRKLFLTLGNWLHMIPDGLQGYVYLDEFGIQYLQRAGVQVKRCAY